MPDPKHHSENMPGEEPVKILPLFTLDGFVFRLIERIDNFAIYEQSKKDKVYSYEVIRIRVNNAWTIGGKTYPKREAYPSSEQWGIHGWTCRTLDDARVKLHALTGTQAAFTDTKNS